VQLSRLAFTPNIMRPFGSFSVDCSGGWGFSPRFRDPLLGQSTGPRNPRLTCLRVTDNTPRTLRAHRAMGCYTPRMNRRHPCQAC